MADAPHPAFSINLADEAATRTLAERVAAAALPGDVVALFGDLGSGKTIFARAFINARAETPEEVPSPTFTLVQTYEFPSPEGVVPVYHFDLYRIEDGDDLQELGMEDAFLEGISLIEWPERMGERINSPLARNRLDVTLRQGGAPEQRSAVLTGHGTWGSRLGILKDKDRGQ